jgi:hypothetical protein
MLRHPERITNYLIKTAESNQTPTLLIKWLKYFSMVMIVSFIISWIPFNGGGLFYSLNGFVLIFVVGRLLTRWDDLKSILPLKRQGLVALSKRTGIFLMTFALFSFVMWYFHVSHKIL